MGKRNQLDIAIDDLKGQRAVLDAAITALEQQQKRQAPKRKGRQAAQGAPGETAASSRS